MNIAHCVMKTLKFKENLLFTPILILKIPALTILIMKEFMVYIKWCIIFDYICAIY